MTDEELAKLSPEELDKLYAAESSKAQAASKAKNADADLSKLSPKELDELERRNQPSTDRWTTTRILNAATRLAGTGRSIADTNVDVAKWLAKQAGFSDKWQDNIGMAARVLAPIPGSGFMPTGEESKGAIKDVTGFQDQNAKDVAGISGSGKVIDTATEAGISSLLTPTGSLSSVARNVLPSVVAGATSEAGGQLLKDTPFETPARVFGGLLSGTGTGVAQNLAGNVVQGIKNVARSDVTAKETAARIIGRAIEREKSKLPAGGQMTFPELAARHADMPEGTPLVAAGGSNLQGAVRGAYTAPGPGRGIIEEGTENFFKGTDAAANRALDKISTAPSVPTRLAQLDEDAAKAGPLFKQAGVPDDPQVILQRQPGQLRPTPSAILGPDGKPVMVMKPGPDTTTVSSAGLKIQSPDLTKFMDESGYAKQAINTTRKLSGYGDLPLNDMVMVDKVYKHLGDLERTAARDGYGTTAREVGNERRKLLEIITKENPAYADALKAHGDPTSLARAVEAGQRAAQRNVQPDEMTQIYNSLPDEAHRAEFRGGFTDALRGKADATNRASAAERIWNSTDTEKKVAALVTPSEAGPTNTFAGIKASLDDQKTTARALREVTKGSQTGRVLSELADNAGTDVGGLIQSLQSQGIWKTVWEKLLTGKFAEGRTSAVNEEIARMAMATKPEDIARNASMIERARQAAAIASAGRTAAPLMGGGVQGLLTATNPSGQPPPPPMSQSLTGQILQRSLLNP